MMRFLIIGDWKEQTRAWQGHTKYVIVLEAGSKGRRGVIASHFSSTVFSQAEGEGWSVKGGS